MRLVMFREKDRALVLELFAQVRLEPDLFFHPDRHRGQKRNQTAGREAEISREEPIEFEKRFFVERDEIKLGGIGETGLAQAIIDRVSRKAGVMFFSRETLFLGGRQDFAIAHQAGGAVMVKRRDAENVHRCRARNLASSCAAISCPAAFQCASSEK